MIRTIFLMLICFCLATSTIHAQFGVVSSGMGINSSNDKITINGTTYNVMPFPSCPSCKMIALENGLKLGMGVKMASFGLIDSNNNVIIPCEYASLIPDLERGCIITMTYKKKGFGINVLCGVRDFAGKEILPSTYKTDLKNQLYPYKPALEAFDKLDEKVKQECLVVYNQISGSTNSENAPQLAQQAVATPSQNSQAPAAAPRQLSDVDKNIPETDRKAEDTYVLIIANENYAFVDNVEFALNDGNTFKEYCIKTLGVPEKQIWFFENASYGILKAGISKMVQAMNLFEGANAIVYYCGHGIPDEKSNDAYIIPTDGNGKDMETCYSLKELYKTLAQTKAGNVTYFLDACFTGAKKDGSMLVAARGVAIKPKAETLAGNTVVFSATSADETAMAYKEKQHGLFTYYLLKKLQETKGDVSYGELSEYLQNSVKKESFLINEKLQTPMVSTSPAVQNSWKNLELK